MVNLEQIQQGMQVYGANNQALGAVSAVHDDAIEVNGQRILGRLITGVSGDRVQVDYTDEQFVWQGGALDHHADASGRPTGAEDSVTLLEQREDKPIKS